MGQFAQLNWDVIKTRPLLLPRRALSYVLFEGRPLFARARWLNLLVFGQLSIAKGLALKSRVVKPIYILGMGRSGTTVLGNIFFLHPHVGLLHEPRALWHSIFANEDVIGSYSDGPAYYRLDETMATPTIKRSAHRIYTSYLRLTGARRVVDKSPEFVFRLPFLREIFPDAKFIFLVRNGMDTIRSVSSWARSHNRHNRNGMHYWWGAHRRKWKLLVEQVVGNDDLLGPLTEDISMLERDIDMAAVEWICTSREGLHHMQTMPETIFQLNYDALVRNPESRMRALLEFCELPADDAMLEYASNSLAPLPQKEEAATIHPVLLQPFVATMQSLGYSTSQLRMMDTNRHGVRSRM